MVDQILSYKRDPNEDYYAILGCSELSSSEQITAEFKARVLNCHPDKQPEKEGVLSEFQLLHRAKQVLTDPELRKCYDAWRLSGIAVKFEDWLANRHKTMMSMHWAGSEAKKPMLDEKSAEQRREIDENENKNENQMQWKSCNSDIIKKFRRYEI